MRTINKNELISEIVFFTGSDTYSLPLAGKIKIVCDMQIDCKCINDPAKCEKCSWLQWKSGVVGRNNIFDISSKSESVQ